MRNDRVLKIVGFLGAALLVAGCAVGPDYRQPEALAARATGASPPIDGWWRGFDDPMLVTVVEQATSGNLDIAQAEARVLAARAAAREIDANLSPSGAIEAHGQEVRESLDSPIGTIGRHLPGFHRDTPLYDLGGALSWDLDPFGGLRRGREAARADALAQAARARAVRLAVVADAADAYLQARALQSRLAVAARREAVQSDLVALLKRRVDQGVVSERDLRLTQAALEEVRAGIPPLRTALEAQFNRLDVLTGEPTRAWRTALATDAPLPAPPALRPGDGRADLLRRRPDIMAAEEGLIAANARIGQAVAEYYPKVSISALLGVESLNSKTFFAVEAMQATGGGALRWRLFDFRRVDAEVARARAEDMEALSFWRATALRASGEVDDAMTDLTQQEARADSLGRQIAQLSIARRQAQQAFGEGAGSLVEVRDADRDLLVAEDQLAQARAGAALAAVASYRALGGGWG